MANEKGLFLLDLQRELKSKTIMSENDNWKIHNARKRPSEDVTISLPVDVLKTLQDIAEQNDLPLKALIKFYISSGLRGDMAELSQKSVYQTTADVLRQHIDSEEKVELIVNTIREENTVYDASTTRKQTPQS